ncbi:branched-chain amino acid aminotransferase [Glutamicibacter sp. JL.03c]|uniref:branched-chain amino acid aminotransferase n=1 Tax=Glutamicibacter sp. JL.03c TaxID=2984842 RepID=UPI0021F7E1A7|nr:branched-chain amino acid aminotransferase [Glutamicibacter sp. JL.03c]UYQ77731.1 branched-chain amino acid aminotransferase [Glutamicibacter sp. JL.03c]
MTKVSFTRTSITTADRGERNRILANPIFGKHFTDHMASISWTKTLGWHNAEILPYGPISFDPAASVFHYGQEIFEGLKAFKQPDGSMALFRPELNARRMNASAQRLALPQIDEHLFVQALHELLQIDADWVPDGPGQSLYLRPLMISDETFIGIRAAHAARFLVIASPAGNYFSAGLQPISLWRSEEHFRASYGGTGAAKCGGNYAAAMLPQQEASAHGCDQVLFTDPNTEDTIDEAASMNIFLVTHDRELITPKLNGNILDGITRRSVIELAKELGLRVSEREVTVTEWVQGLKNGRITEAFACGTAAVIVPIRELRSRDFVADFGTNSPGPITLMLREELLGIQRGNRPDIFGWLDHVDSNTGC